ncbi:MAG: PQQ-like beta-propeller repeat protein, partial [Chloroflexi bacterium]|nr:PQQ-like beta-propeller repeat protein [Chloroflexota bacterium]
YAVNPDGNQRWRFETGSAISSTPAVGPDGTVYVGSWDGKLYAVDPATGNEDWSYTTAGYIRSSPALAGDGTVYIGASWDGGWYEMLYAIQPPISGDTGVFQWKINLGYSGSGEGDQIVSLPVVDGDGRIYVGGKDGQVRALNTDNSIVWTYLTENQVDASPAIGADGTLYVGSWDGRLYAFGTPLSACSNMDFDADGRITVVDIMHLVVRWGKSSSDPDWNPRYDLVENDQIDVDDIMAVAANWRTIC